MLLPAVVFVLLHAQAALAGEEPSLDVSVGIRRLVKVGRWAPISVKTTDSSIASIEIESFDPAGKLVRFPLRKSAGDSTAGAVYRGLFQVGKLEATVSLRITRSDESVHHKRLGGGKTDVSSLPLAPVLRQSIFLVATLGRPAGFARLAGEEESDENGDSATTESPQEASFRTLEFSSADDFPDTVQGLQAVNAIVISGTYRFNARQDAALRSWVRGGGHLVVCRGTNLQPFLEEQSARGGANKSNANDALLAAWLPVAIRRQLRLRAQDLAALRDFSKQKIPIISSGRIPSAQVDDPRDRPGAAGLVLAGGGELPNLIVRVPYGFGIVTFCGIDFHQPPVSTWVGINALGREILRPDKEAVAAERTTGGRRVSGTGLSDLSTQLHAIQDDFPQVRRESTWRTMLWVLLYIALIGPLDYLVVHRVLKKPRYTWVTFPLLVGLVTWWSVANAANRNGRELRLNQLSIIDVDATDTNSGKRQADQSVVVRSWFTVYSPETRRYSLAVESDNAPTPRSAGDVVWSGIPEDVYGGMHRTGGLEIGRLSYSIQPERGRIDELPLRIWSSQTIAGTQRYGESRLVGGRLTLTPTGRLTGTIEHRFPSPLTDWVIAYRQKLYRPDRSLASDAVKTIPPNTPWSLSRAGIIQHTIEDDLKSLRFNEVDEDNTLETAALTQQSYNPRSRDLEGFLHVLTFHRQLRGREYTGLRNIPLAELDFTRLLSLNRAVLIGRIEHAPAKLVEIANGSSDNSRSVLQPTKSHTYVRIVLPVFPAGNE